MPGRETFQLSGRRIWLTGGSGFLGTHVQRVLEQRGACVLATSSADVDLLDPFAAQAFLSEHRPDGVIHLAGKVGGIGYNRAHPGAFFYDNMVMGLHLVEACRRELVEKLLVVGTVCSYPKHCPVPFREEDLWMGFPEETNAPYGIAKKALLVQLQGYRQEYGLRGVFIIPVNLYGPGDHLDLASNHVIPALVRKFLTAKAEVRPFVELWGTGEVSREFLFVEDAAEGICQAMSCYEDADPVNLGTGHEISIRALAETIQELVGYEGAIRFNPAFPDGQPRRRLDTGRAKVRFGWEATTPLRGGLVRTIEWMKGVLGM